VAEALQITLEKVGHRFGRRLIFSDIDLTIQPGEILVIGGRNGSGKSTLLKVIAKILTPTKGTCEWTLGGKKLESDDLIGHRGFVGPYLELYDTLNASEHLKLVADLRSQQLTADEGEALLSRLGLPMNGDVASRYIGAFSSGMKQRVKIAMALVNSPKVLLLDEPTTNLDEEGQELVFGEIRAHQNRGGTTIIATNEAKEKALATNEMILA
jgi:heme exporter protein A